MVHWLKARKEKKTAKWFGAYVGPNGVLLSSYAVAEEERMAGVAVLLPEGLHAFVL